MKLIGNPPFYRLISCQSDLSGRSANRKNFNCCSYFALFSAKL